MKEGTYAGRLLMSIGNITGPRTDLMEHLGELERSYLRDFRKNTHAHLSDRKDLIHGTKQ